MLIGTLLDELERRDLQTGLVTMCTGGGMGTATIIERICQCRSARATAAREAPATSRVDLDRVPRTAVRPDKETQLYWSRMVDSVTRLRVSRIARAVASSTPSTDIRSSTVARCSLASPPK